VEEPSVLGALSIEATRIVKSAQLTWDLSTVFIIKKFSAKEFWKAETSKFLCFSRVCWEHIIITQQELEESQGIQ